MSGGTFGRGGRRRLPFAIWVIAAVVAIAVIAVIAMPSVVMVGAALARDESTRVDAIPQGSPSSVPTVPLPAGAEPLPAGDDPRSPSPSPSESNSAADALELLAGVPEATGKSIARYYREQFGQAWYDQDRNGCDTRNDILRRDLTGVVLKEGTNDCKVLSGTLLDPYTGASVPFVSGADTSALVQIDHLVPLAWAWRQGAETWSFDERMAFANDPLNLQATGGEANQSKSDSGPSEWLPPDSSQHCAYAERFTTVISQWKLGVNSADRAALEESLRMCG
jgi:hypothetical protein